MTNKIIKFISEYQKMEIETINVDTNFAKDIDMSSMDIMQMCCYIEDEFNIEISDEDVYGLRTVGDVVNYVEQKVMG